nr:reverse transcriptase domain-containing protein [Tanacetum cinerariifolium]
MHHLLGEWKKGDKDIVPVESPILMVSRGSLAPKRKSVEELIDGIGEITFPCLPLEHPEWIPKSHSLASRENIISLSERIGTVHSTYKPNKVEEGQKKFKGNTLKVTKNVLSCADVEERIIVNDKYPEQRVVIGKQLSISFKKKLQDILRAKTDVFAWTYADMTGISRTIMVGGNPYNMEQNLNEYKHIKPVPQKKQGLAPKRNLKDYIDHIVIKSVSEYDMLMDIQETFDRLRSITMKLNLKKCSLGVEEGQFLGHLITKQGIKENPLKETSKLQDTTCSQEKKETKAFTFYRMETKEMSERYIAPCFVNGLEAYDGEINLEQDKNLISNEFAAKLCLEHEVKDGDKMVKKELIMALKGEIYFVKFIINPKEDDIESGVILGRSFMRLTKGITDFGNGVITIYPKLDPLLDYFEETKKSKDDWELILDGIDSRDILEINEAELPSFLCKMGNVIGTREGYLRTTR